MSELPETVAVDCGDTVLVHSDKITYTLSKEEYEYAKSVMTYGIDMDQLSPIINVHDIIGYLNESNPEAEQVVTEREVSMALRSQKAQNLNIIAYGVAVFMAAMAVIAIYVVFTSGDGGSAGTIAQSAASTLTVG